MVSASDDGFILRHAMSVHEQSVDAPISRKHRYNRYVFLDHAAEDLALFQAGDESERCSARLLLETARRDNHMLPRAGPF